MRGREAYHKRNSGTNLRRLVCMALHQMFLSLASRKDDSRGGRKMWVSWNYLETPSALKPFKISIRCPVNVINGGPVMPQRKTVPILMFTLECGHLSATWRNTAETELRCMFHDKKSKITGIHVYEWRARCMYHDGQRPCRFTRWTGTSKSLAGDAANKHARTHPSHAAFIGLEYVVRPDAQAELEKRLANGAFIS